MSFRLRVLALVALVVVIATAVTAGLTFQQASRQITDSADAQRADVDAITAELTNYGRTHGTWEGVPQLVADLGNRTGQRIQLVTGYGEVVVDTDTLEGRTARPVDSPPISVNPRPTLELPEAETQPQVVEGETLFGDVVGRGSLLDTALQELGSYRAGVRFAACLTRNGIPVVATDGPYGVPSYAVDPTGDGYPADQVVACEADAGTPAPTEPDRAAMLECEADVEASGFRSPAPSADPEPDRFPLQACLSVVFSNRIEEFAPVPLDVYLGAVDDADQAPLAAGPVLAAAGLVAALAVAGSLLISRRVLRPIQALTTAARRFGEGDLNERVPVAGRDELAGLARSFNRMADSLQRGEERQRRLVADVAHELRTPLANLRGYLEALKDGVVTPDPELFASLYEESVLQQRILDDLQDLALAEAGTMLYHRSRVDVGELLEICRTTHQAVAEAAGVRLTAEPAGPVQLDADPDRLRQVLGNLVGNAIRATAAGGSVTLTAQRAGEWAVVAVSDTGSGIEPEHLPYVFDRFWRADGARGRATGGSGLGLAIARQIVTDHGGMIQATSALGVGTTFTIRLPAGTGR